MSCVQVNIGLGFIHIEYCLWHQTVLNNTVTNSISGRLLSSHRYPSEAELHATWGRKYICIGWNKSLDNSSGYLMNFFKTTVLWKESVTIVYKY